MDSPHVSRYSGRKFRINTCDNFCYQELVCAGFVEEFPITVDISRYELVCNVDIVEPERSGNKCLPDYTVALTDEQRELLAREQQNDREVSHAIAGEKYEKSNFDSRCLGNYARI